MAAAVDVDRRIDELDLTLFDSINSESGPGDRRSWLALQRASRRMTETYSYLEIGSHLGGSIQPYLVDSKCRTIYSIDPRPLDQADDRGQRFSYPGNSSARMLDNLRAIDASQVPKIVCLDVDARDVDPSQISDPPILCFIDGQHTFEAAMSDFEFCTRVCAPNAVIYFHDDWVIHAALAEISRRLTKQGTPHSALKLQGVTYAIVMGDSKIVQDDSLRAIATDPQRFLRRMRLRGLAKHFVPRSLLAAAAKAKAWFRIS